MYRFIPWSFLIVGVVLVVRSVLEADPIGFGIGSLFAVLGGADIAERLTGEQGDESY